MAKLKKSKQQANSLETIETTQQGEKPEGSSGRLSEILKIFPQLEVLNGQPDSPQALIFGTGQAPRSTSKKSAETLEERIQRCDMTGKDDLTAIVL